MFDTRVTKIFEEAIKKFAGVESLLATYSREYSDVDEWDCWCVANELRCAGQHLCRTLTARTLRKKRIEEQLTKSHCRHAMHDASDFLILFYREHIGRNLEKARSEGEDLSKIQKFQKEFWKICSEIAKNRRTNKGFELARQACIAKLQEMFLTIKEPDRCWDHSLDSSNPRQIYVLPLKGFDKNPRDIELVECYNKAEEYLKKLELLKGTLNPFFVQRIFDAACCLVPQSGNVDKEKFMQRCGSVQILILLDALFFLMKSTGSTKTEIDTEKAHYAKLVHGGCDYSTVKEKLLLRIEYFIPE